MERRDFYLTFSRAEYYSVANLSPYFEYKEVNFFLTFYIKLFLKKYIL